MAYDVRVGPGFLVSDRENGYLVPEGDREAYEERLVELMKDPELRERMGENARRHAASFSREAVAEKWFTVIG